MPEEVEDSDENNRAAGKDHFDPK